MNQTGFLDEMRSNRPVDDTQYYTHLCRLTRKQKPQGKRHAQHPLAQGLTRQHLINQQRRTLNHTPRATTRAKAPPFATKRNRLLRVAALTTDSQESVFQPATAQ